MVPWLVKEPVLPPVSWTPIADAPPALEIAPLFTTALFELRVTAAPLPVIATEPELVIVILPGVPLAAVKVATAAVVLVLMVRSSASAGIAVTTTSASAGIAVTTTLMAPKTNTLRFTIATPPI